MTAGRNASTKGGAPMGIDAGALRRAHYNAALTAVRRVTDTLAILRVRPDAGIPPYAAGQWIALGIGAWEPRLPGLPPEPATGLECELIRRPFSLSSPILAADASRLLAPGEEQDYEFYVALPRDHAIAAALPGRLFALMPGDRLWVDDAPRGRNTLVNVRDDDDVLLAATGTGEAPHNRMVWELLRRQHRGRIAAVVTTRLRSEQAYRDVHERLTRLFANYRYTAIATREPGAPGERLQDLFRSGALEALAGFRLDPQRARIFLCGNPEMIGAPRLEGGQRVYPKTPGMIELLERERGFRADDPAGGINVHFERYA
jgi:ferredoxin--NADP+ reductase